MLGHRTRQSSIEAGERRTLADVAANPIRVWDSRGHIFRTAYDALRRPQRWFVQGAGPDADPDTTAGPVLYQRTEYGEEVPDAAAINVRGRVSRQFDAAGVVTHRYDFKGNVTAQVRAVAPGYVSAIDWAAAQPARRGVHGVHPLRRAQPPDPVDRAAQQPGARQRGTSSSRCSTRPTCWSGWTCGSNARPNPAGLLDPAVERPVTGRRRQHRLRRQGPAPTHRLQERRQHRLRLRPADLPAHPPLHTPRRGASPRTATTRSHLRPPSPRRIPARRGKPCGLQNLHYTYDPAGNITHIRTTRSRPSTSATSASSRATTTPTTPSTG